MVMISVQTFPSAWCAYRLNATVSGWLTDKLIYWGVCPLDKLPQTPDLKCQSEWQRGFRDQDTINLTGVFIFPTEQEAIAWADLMIITEKPYINTSPNNRRVKAPSKRGKTKPIRDPDTGEIFNSMTEAAERYGVTVAAISKCVEGKIKYVMQHRFERLEQ